MTTKIITFCFYLIFFLTPLLWTPFNFELFEYNKMMFIYVITTLILACWLIQMLNRRQLILKTTVLDIPLLLFLTTNILSTIFSIDSHTSVWGYYSRSNGGLLSIICYIILYYALVSNFTPDQALKFLKSALWGGLLVTLWAIPEHFGISLSCIILGGKFNDSCWVQDVQARVFATLGQPNWLAAYLAMLIFPAFYFLLSAKNILIKSGYLALILGYYLAFTFTYSRGATLGLIAGMIVFLVSLSIWQKAKVKLQLASLILITIISILLINLLFGSALTDFKLVSKFASPTRPVVSLVQTKASPSASTGTQLETGGTESGKIRLIVWKGALDIFKHYPIFGSGVETFAYSYYQFRPIEHNLVSEWDFLYNKAHNEYLNYLATTGIAGFSSYIALISVFVIWSIKYLLASFKKEKSNSNYFIFNTAIFAAYTSYLVQNLFSFSVVEIALLFYLFPSLVFTYNASASTADSPKALSKIVSIVYKRQIYIKVLIFLLITLAVIIVTRLVIFYVADTFYARGFQANELGNSGKAYNNLTVAVFLNPQEPLYHIELGYAAAGASVASSDEATLSAKLQREAISETENTLASSNKNISLIRTAIRTYFILSTSDKSFIRKTLDTIDQAIALAPTDPKLVYNKALVLSSEGQNQEAVIQLQKAILLKPNYRDAYFTLGLIYYDLGQNDQAINQMQSVLKIIPNDPEAKEKLATWVKTI